MSRRPIDIYDPIEDKIPQKKKMNPKKKKVLIYSLCVLVGLLVAVGAIFIFDMMFTGASTPEEAIAEYQKASLLYDIDNMIEYSSDYNKVVLYGNRETSDRLLRSYLNKAYEGYESKYTEDQLSFKLISVLEYERGESKYDLVMKRYIDKIPTGEEDVDKIAIVTMTVVTSDSETTRDYLAVKCGMRWFYAFAGV